MRLKKYGWYECEPIADLKELVDRSACKYGSRDAFRRRTPEGGIQGFDYKRLKRDTEALGKALLELGLYGCHIAVIGENSYEWVVTYLAVVNSVGVIVPIDKELSREEIAGILRHSDCGAIVYSQSFEPLIRHVKQEVPGLKYCINMHAPEDSDGSQSFAKLLEKGAKLQLDPRPIDAEQMCSILYTSGTTGSSKGVMLSHKNIVSAIIGAMQAINVEKVAMSVLPIHHAYECTCGLLTAIYEGVTVCFCDNLKHVAENLQLFKPYMMLLVPMFLEAMYKKIWDKAKSEGMDGTLRLAIKFSNFLRKFGIDIRPLLFRRVRAAFGGRLKLIVSGGAPLRAELVTGFDDIGIKILNGYGITECSPLVSVNRNRYCKADSVGVVIPCCNVHIHLPDENGTGEILVKGDNVMLGYYKNQSETEKSFYNGWFRTGDLGSLDRDGFLYVTGRLKNTIILSNGKNIQPEELEELLLNEIPYIKEVVVLSSDDYYESSVDEAGAAKVLLAVCVLDRDYIAANGIENPEDKLKADIQNINRRLPTFKQIVKVETQYDEFEKTTSKKIKRYKVREETKHDL